MRIYKSKQQMWFNFGDESNIIIEPDTTAKKRGRKPKQNKDFIISDGNAKVYKMTINKQLLKEMLLDTEGVSENVNAYIKELNKMVGVIFNKHFSKYYTMKDDLEADAVLAVYNKRQYYDAEKDAYNFIYAIMRNEMTNKLSKLNKIALIDTYDAFNEVRKTEAFNDNTIPQNIIKWSDYLVGDTDFNYVKLPKQDVLIMLVWLKIHEKGIGKCAPSFIKPTENNINALYKLLKLIIGC